MRVAEPVVNSDKKDDVKSHIQVTSITHHPHEPLDLHCKNTIKKWP